MQPIDRVEGPHGVQIITGLGEVGAVAAVDAAAIYEQRLVAVWQRGPVDRVLLQVELGNTSGDPVEQFEAIGVATVHVGKDRA
jgi:hypothetical protein